MSAHTHSHPEPGHTHAHHHHHHDHHHDEGDTYFIDQLCMVGLSGAFGVICLCLWFWQTRMLENLLASQFHIYVLLSGIVLTLIAFVRGGVLWFQSRDPDFLHKLAHAHGHAHDHSHGHDHAVKEQSTHLQPGLPVIEQHGAPCGHTHAPGETCSHEHVPHTHAPPQEHEHEHPPAQDHDEADHDHGWAPWRYVVILVPIILFLLGLPSRQLSLGDSNHERLIGDFASIIYEALPFIVLGVLIAGLLEEFVPQQAIAKIVPRNHVLAIAIGALLGLVFPMCECGIIVVMKRLLRKGLPLSVCVAYMLAGPVINVIVMGSTLVAFSGYNQPGRNDVLGGPFHVVAWRVGLSYLVACVTALIVEWQWRKHGRRLLHPSVLRGLKGGPASDENGVVKRPWNERVNNITQTALHDFVDIMAFLVLGSVLAAGGKFVISESNIQEVIRQAPAISILLMMGIAILFCLCSEADAFVAANFPLFWPDGSKLAFLVLGPMLDLKLLLMYTRVFRARLIYTIVIALVAQVFLYTTVVHALVGRNHPLETKKVVIPPNIETHLLGIGLGPDPLTQFTHFSVAYRKTGKGEKISYKKLYELADRADQRDYWKSLREPVVEVRGEYQPLGNDHVFNLVRVKIQCCRGDGIFLQMPVVARESISGYKLGDWIQVTGRVEFREQGGRWFTVLMVSGASDIEPCLPDRDPYIK